MLVVGTEVRPQIVIAKIEEQRLEQITRAQNQLSILRKQLADISSQQNNANVAITAIVSPFVEALVESEDGKSQTALAIEAVPESTTSIMNKWLETLKRFFFRTRE